MQHNDGDTGLTVGERIELRRHERGLSRRVVADAVGRSEEWLRLVESGKQPLDSLQAITGLAAILRISDFRLLIAPSRRHLPTTSTAARPLLHTIERAVFSQPDPLGAGPEPEPEDTLPSLAADVERCRTIWRTAPNRYSALAITLPRVIVTCRTLRSRTGGPATAAAAMDCYHLTRLVLTGLGGHDLAMIVADRAWEMALELDRPLDTARAAWHIAEALLHSGRFTKGIDYALDSAQRLTPHVPTTPEAAHLWGALHLTAGMGAFLSNDGARAGRLLALVHEAGPRCDDTCTVTPCTGPDAVGLARMQMALRQDNFDEVVRTAGEVDLSDRHSVTTRTRYHLDLGTAYTHLGEPVAASLAFARAAEICPEELVYHPVHCELERQWYQEHSRLLDAEVTRGPLGA